jgi:hypothetical protein
MGEGLSKSSTSEIFTLARLSREAAEAERLVTNLAHLGEGFGKSSTLKS